MSPIPTVCSFILGRPCDYYAREDGYLPYVVSRDEVLVDIWTGAPLLSNRDELEDVLRRESRVWLVVDGHRLTTRYDPDTTRTVVEQFSVAYEDDNVRALVADGWTPPPQYTIRRSVDSPVGVGPLTLLGWERTEGRPGEDMHILLLWDEQNSIEEQLHTSVQLVAADSLRITQADGPPARGMIWTNERPKYQLPDPKKLRVPSDLEPGVYRLELTAYEAETETPAADFIPIDWLRVGPEPAAPAIRTDVKWENGVVLQGYDAIPSSLSAGQQVPLRLLWTTTDSIDTDYKVFVHLVGPNGDIVAQDDNAPMAGFYPTSRWTSGDLIEDHHTVHVPEPLTAGTYTLRIGLYRADTGERPLRTNGEETIELASWQIHE